MPKSSPLTLGRAAPRGALALLFVLLAAHAGRAQTPAERGAPPASVSGRVRDGERGLPGVTVMLISGNVGPEGLKARARAKTDAEGRYRMAGVAPGRYHVLPVAPTYVVRDMTEYGTPGKPLTLLAGEEVSDVDFRVERGAVITGRVTDGDGNPVIAEAVTIAPADNKTPQATAFHRVDPRDTSTDDRGVYRIYGLPAGRYRVSVGQGTEDGGAVSYGRRRVFRRTFHPGVTEEARARVVEVGAGDEAKDVDITLGRPLKTYRASGRFVSAETGRPLPNVAYAYGALDSPRGRVSSFSGGGQLTGPLGEFQTEGLAPGRYAVFAMPRDGSEMYGDPVYFEVADADVTGLMVQMRRGASVSGVVHIEGLGDRAQAARLLSQVRVSAHLDSPERREVPSYMRPSPVAPDGSFRVAGLRAGNLRLGASGPAKGLSLTRVEFNGAPATGGIPVTEGAQLSGVRIILNYGSAAVRGQVSFVNGTLPPGARAVAVARNLAAAEGAGWHHAAVDVRGFFHIEGLPAGDYEVSVRVFGSGPDAVSEPQRVTLPDGGEASLSPVVDLGRPDPTGAGPGLPPVKP